LLLKLGTESSLAPAATIPGTDALLVTMGAETGGIAATLAASDTLLVTYLTETVTVLGTITNVSASDTLLLALSDTSVSIYEILYPTASDTLLLALSDTSASPAGAVSAADTLLLKYGTESGNYSYDLSAADTLLLKYGTESSLYPAATIPGTDILYIDPDIEGFDLNAAISASDTLLIDPDYDVGYVGNVHGACEATVRAIHAKARITYSDPSLNEAVTITATDTAEGTDPYDTADNITGSDYKWFSLQENDLSGDYHAMPDSVGWWSATLSDANGEFSPGMVLTVEMESPRPIYNLKVYGDDKLDNYPVDFTVKLYDDSDTLLYTETVTGNTLWNWEKTLTSMIADVAKMVLTITKISQAARSAIVTEFYTAYYEDYTDSDIMYMSVLEERDYSGGTLPIGNVSSNEIVLRLNNADNHFSVDNESSEIYDIMKKNRRIEAWIGVEVPYGGEVTWEKIGTFWSQDWSAPQDEVYAEVIGFDRLELLRNTEFYSSQVYEDYTLSQLAALILTDAGLSASEYSIHSSLASITIPYAWFDRTTHRDALIEIAEAIGGTVYCDRDGLIVITPYADEATPSYTLSSDLYFTKDQPLAFSEIVNYVEVRAKPRSPGTQEVIYSDTESLVVPGAVDGVNGEAERWCIFNASDPCIDVQTATWTATGGTITLKSQVDYSWATLLTYQNTNVEAGTVTDIEIQGKVLGTTGEKVAIAQDADSIRLNGKQALSDPIENEFIQTKARAQDIADAILAAYKDPRRDVVVQARGYTMSRLGERMTVQSLDGSVSNDYTITRQQIEYDGGLRVEMTGQKITEA